MSLTWVIIGSFFQLAFSGFLFMMAVFAWGGIANGKDLSTFSSAILAISLYFLPFLGLLSTGIVIYQYTHNGTASSYWWYLMPIVAAILYVLYISVIWKN
ncbi:hypothetical protein ACJJIF_01300 [Microbulbifer sp. SSSA002]|uniref:hypothetical protein n=1 Tax=Microbulbifer sp. SSSA002 TaxID=3243376 RepID=UPI0040394620